MRYLICGDVHTSWLSLDKHIKRVQEKQIPFDEILQVGDFGIYKDSIDSFKAHFKKNTVPISFIDGNHEDHKLIRSIWQKDWQPLQKKYQTTYRRRGEVITTQNDRIIGFIGGALNVDRPQEMDDGNWYLNIPSPSEVLAFLQKANELDRPIDLMVTHSCPGGIGIGMKGHSQFEPGVKMFIEEIGLPIFPQSDIGDFFLTDIWNRLKHKPLNWVFGHFHNYHKAQIGNTKFQCIGLGDMYMNLRRIFIYDTETNEVLT